MQSLKSTKRQRPFISYSLFDKKSIKQNIVAFSPLSLSLSLLVTHMYTKRLHLSVSNHSVVNILSIKISHRVHTSYRGALFSFLYVKCSSNRCWRWRFILLSLSLTLTYTYMLNTSRFLKKVLIHSLFFFSFIY